MTEGVLCTGLGVERTRVCTLALALGGPHLFFWSSVLASILPSVKWGYKVRRWDIYLTSSCEIHIPCSAQQSRVSVFIIISNILTASIFLNRTWGKLFSSYLHSVAVVHLLSHVQLFATPWTTARQALHPLLSHGVCPNSCPLSR